MPSPIEKSKVFFCTVEFCLMKLDINHLCFIYYFYMYDTINESIRISTVK